MISGYANKILYIDLSNKKIYTENIKKYLSFIGGRGINQFLLFNLVNKNVKPLDRENVIILGAGPLVGTLFPATNRLSIDFKNVITNGVGSANCGGHFAAEMKYAGYDHIVLLGKAKYPIYLYIKNSEVYFRDAQDIWGKTTWETEEIIKEKENDELLKTLSIGVAGENLVKFACIIADKGRAAAYGGSGAVLGSKNVKAIAIRGTLSFNIANPEKMLKLSRFYKKEVIENSKMVDLHRRGGTLLAYLLPGENRPHAVRNMNDGFWSDENIDKVTREGFDRNYLVRRHSCFNCPLYCSGIFQVDKLRCEGFQANSWRSFASNLDCIDPEKILYAHALTNLFGLDGDHTSGVLAWAIECYENGVLSKSDTDGLELRWGNGDSIIKLIKNIAHRKGFGNILAEGVYEASKIVSTGSEKFTVLSKKNVIMEDAIRSYKAWALGIMTSTKGSGHLRGAPVEEFQEIKPEISKELFNIDEIVPTSYQHAAKLVTWQENYKGIIDAMGICALPTMWQDINLYRPEFISQCYYAISGINKSVQELFLFGSRLQNLERSFNVLHADFGRKEDLPPNKLVKKPVTRGKFRGERLDLEKWNNMLDEYYTLHDWDLTSGWPTKKRLIKLQLKKVAERLKENGILLP